jgi:Dyp-type peroxidase family
MAIDLTRPASEVTTGAGSPYRPMLEKLQGNVLKPHGRNVERHVFLRFTGSPAEVRQWIREKLVPRILTSAAQFDQAAARRADPDFDGGMVTLFYLSSAGYRFLGFNPRVFESEAFRKGMKDQGDGIVAEALGFGNKDPKPVRWERGFRGEIHAMVQLGDDAADETRLLNGLSLLQTELANLAEILTVETGRALRRTVRDGQQLERPEPIEHFGYFDGISQPLFTADDLQNYYDDGKGTQGPGAWDPSATLELVLVDDPFADEEDAYGSYFVYRKLHQDFGRFEDRVADCAQAIGHSPDLAGAMAVGRFKDGTPVADFAVPTANYTNDFVFKSGDPDGFKCPVHAHVRKVNPRGTTPRTSPERERRRRIARRGIPYGKPMPDICDAVQTDSDPHGDRGLLFMCFQANIEDQFQFIQRVWVDNPNFPTNVLNLPSILGGQDSGDDPLIGQDQNEPQRWPKTWDNSAAGRTKFNFESAVTLKGGEYFFAPSRPFLAAL